jgi:CheY-specific phosphatase CheX
MPAKLSEIIAQAAREFFTSSGITEWKQAPAAKSDSEYQWTGIIGLSGDLIRGSLAITCQEQLLRSTHPNFQMEMPVTNEDLVDWIGEMSNQILGRIKNLTLEYSVSFSLSAPSVVKGQTLQVLGQAKKIIETFNFVADGNPVTITVVCVINPNFNFDTAVKIDKADKASEGQSLLF